MSAATMESLELYTPEQLEKRFGFDDQGRPHLSAYEIRRRVRDREVEAMRGPRQRILFTAEQAHAILESMHQPAGVKRVEPEKAKKYGLRTSARSRPR